MGFIKRITVFLLFVGLVIIIKTHAVAKETRSSMREKLAVKSQEQFQQLEVGGPFAGVEFHKNSILPARISFYYPVANSIDASGDYWNRHLSRVLTMRVKIGDNPLKDLEPGITRYKLTPYFVDFVKEDKEMNLSVSYRFCKNKPAMVVIYEIENKLPQKTRFQVITSMESTLRTSSTYTHKNTAWTDYDRENDAIIVKYDDAETGNVRLFTSNAGLKPESFTSVFNNGMIMYSSKKTELENRVVSRENPAKPTTDFQYAKTLEPGETMKIVQVIGSCSPGEEEKLISYLNKNYQKETDEYEKYIFDKIYNDGKMETGDNAFDHSVLWAKAILAANAHYLRGDIIPMPCPAEYNFFFTHDILLTDLSAVYFDCERVKKDLENIGKYAREDGIIPHAYYWKDDHYEVEYAGADNWNHLWFTMICARYLKHSGDKAAVEKLFPLIKKSLDTILKNEKDGIMWAYRPDWWDIGSKYGPRSYMTILTIRALREFGYISATLEKDYGLALKYEKLASKMEKKLSVTLWDEGQKYLVNYFEDGSKDSHYYSGSLMATHFNLLNETKKTELVKTASQKLLDRKLGIYNAFPMDFHKLGEFFHFSGNEAGEPYYYMNGGIWCQGTAWYALSLMSLGDKDSAYKLMNDLMTLEGITKSPGGQPAMFEYRVGKPDKGEYGKIDKPQFLWAAGWYLYCWYHLFGAEENAWNLSFTAYIPPNLKQTRYNLLVNGKDLEVIVKGEGREVKKIKYNGKTCPSIVIPPDAPGEEVEIELGKSSTPYICKTGSILVSADWNETKRELKIKLKAYPGHKSLVIVSSPFKSNGVSINGKDGKVLQDNRGDIYQVYVDFVHCDNTEEIIFRF